MALNIKDNQIAENIGVITNFLTEQTLARIYNTYPIPVENYIEFIRNNNVEKIFIELDIYEQDHEWYKGNFSDLLNAAELLNVDVTMINFDDDPIQESIEQFKIININSTYNDDLDNNNFPILINEEIYNPRNNKSVFDILYFGLPEDQYNEEQLEFHRKRGLKVKKINITSLDKGKISTVINSIKKSKIVYFYDMSQINKKFIYYLELIATLFNTTVIYHENEDLDLLYGDKYPNDDSIMYVIQALIENTIFRDKSIIGKTRKALLNNTFISIHSNKNLDQHINFENDSNVSVIISTKRKDYIEGFIEQANNQQHVNLQIILITHGFTLSKKEQKDMKKLSNFDITFVECDQNVSFGNCLNKGIDQIKFNYVIKMDDDDYYYPSFIIDLLLGLKYSQAEVVGKYAFFFYLEGENIVGQRRLKYQYCSIAEIKGNTMICKTETMKNYKFKDLSRHVDSDFLERVRENNRDIYCIHPYDMCVFRSGNKNSHTYQVNDSNFLRDANILYYGLPNNTISSESFYTI